MITTTLGDMDESTLRKMVGGHTNANETASWVEYCLPDCDGVAHVTNEPQGIGLFCDKHIHRSVAIELYKPIVSFQ